MRPAGWWLIAVLAVLGAPALRAQSQPDRSGTESHRQIMTKQFPIPDWVADPNMRRMLEDFFRSQGAGSGATSPSPQQREQMLANLRRIMEQLPSRNGLPDPRTLQGMDGYRELLESYRKLLESQPAAGDPGIDESLYEWMNDLAKDLNGNRPFVDRSEGDSPPLLSPEGAEMMRKMMGEFKLDRKLMEEMKKDFAGLKDMVKDWREWFKDVGRTDSRATKRTDPARTDPTAGPTGGPNGRPNPSGLPRGMTLPSLPAIADFPVREVFHGLLWVSGIGLGMFAVYLLWGMLGDRVRASLARRRIRPPRLPDGFAGPEEFLRLYAPLMAYRIGQPLAGETHRELARRDADLHPAAGAPTREAADLFEALCYDRRALDRAPELCVRAHTVCRSLLDAPA